ncbi:MAG: hypothetical protein H6Q06_2105 [Acidobacteria bacterium]|nr:hypothetical protein [Acidobacteriota bacterium]
MRRAGLKHALHERFARDRAADTPGELLHVQFAEATAPLQRCMVVQPEVVVHPDDAGLQSRQAFILLPQMLAQSRIQRCRHTLGGEARFHAFDHTQPRLDFLQRRMACVQLLSPENKRNVVNPGLTTKSRQGLRPLFLVKIRNHGQAEDIQIRVPALPVSPLFDALHRMFLMLRGASCGGSKTGAGPCQVPAEIATLHIQPSGDRMKTATLPVLIMDVTASISTRKNGRTAQSCATAP